ncbi:MAG: phenylacetate-CoA oxygenase subunit PaaI [Bacteroidetes bacterium]|nr:MAG: phenylacetate-CoA oxygenase subunit PaaI [Bacteroidota bacterium]
MKDKLYQYLLLLGDNPLILGHRLSELCGHGPSLETDIALTNISLDLFGQVRHYFQYAAKLHGDGQTEDDIAMLRLPHEYKNVLLVEQPNTDFAYVIGRQFLFDAYHLPLLEQLRQSKDKQVAAIAAKSIKEVKYHQHFSSEWTKRLGGGTAQSHRRMQKALDSLWRFHDELFMETDLEREMKEMGIGADLAQVKDRFTELVQPVVEEVGLQLVSKAYTLPKGKQGVHSEHLGHILTDLQYMQRTYPNMTW